MIVASFSSSIWILIMTLLRKKQENIFVDFPSFRYFDERTRMEILLIHGLSKVGASSDSIEVKVKQWNQTFKNEFTSTDNAQVLPMLELDQVFQDTSKMVLTMSNTTSGFVEPNLIHQAMNSRSMPMENWDALVAEFQSFVQDNTQRRNIRSSMY
jgi:hypothetical protein